MSDWWAITKQNDLRELRKSANQFVSELELKITELADNSDELITQLKKAIDQFKKEIEK